VWPLRSRSRDARPLARRAAILFLLGMAVYALAHVNDYQLANQRILGVLQRIAICYLVGSVIFLYTGVRGQILWICGLLTAYWMLMTLVPVPGYGPGRLDVEGNFAHWVDRWALGSHNYSHTKTWDPEGLVSTLPAIATTLFGVLAGHLLRMRRTLAERTTWLFVMGCALLVGASICSIWLPVNKKIWTDSFCLLMAGLDFLAMGVCAWLIDGQGWKRPVQPLVILGMNAIAVYLASDVLAIALSKIQVGSGSLHGLVYRSVFVPLASPANASLLFSLTFLLIMYAVAWGMYRRGWFLKV
jgi:predicted acyltransferase